MACNIEESIQFVSELQTTHDEPMSEHFVEHTGKI